MIDQEAFAAERSLVERARTGDRTAFGALAEQYAQPLAAFARRWVGSTDEAHDAAQAAIAQALAGIDRLEDPAAFRGWLYGIALNECRKRHRRAGRLARALAGLREVLVGRSSEPGEEAVDAGRVRAAVARLPEKQRVTVELRIWEGLSCAEAAVALGCTEGTVKANFHHALKKLRDELEGLS